MTETYVVFLDQAGKYCGWTTKANFIGREHILLEDGETYKEFTAPAYDATSPVPDTVWNKMCRYAKRAAKGSNIEPETAVAEEPALEEEIKVD